MVSLDLIHEVVTRVEREGGKVILIGDSRQIAPIQGGEIYRALCSRYGTQNLTDVVRQSVPWMRQASKLLNEHRLEDGLMMYADPSKRGALSRITGGSDGKSRVHFFANSSEVVNHAIERYVQNESFRTDSREHIKNNIILSHKNEVISYVNAEIRSRLQKEGTLDNVEHYLAGNVYSVGERIVFTKNDNWGKCVRNLNQRDENIGVRNNNLGFITSISNDVIQVELDEKVIGRGGVESNRLVEFNIKEYASINHGYAVTFNKAQGVTSKNSIVIPTLGMSTNQFLVALTRHKENCIILVDEGQFGNIKDIVNYGQVSHQGNIVDYIPTLKDRQFKVIVDEYYHLQQAQSELITQISTSQLDSEKYLKNKDQDQATKQEAINSNILKRQYKDMAELKTQIKAQAEKIVNNWDKTRSFAALYGYSLENLQVMAGVREKLYSHLELQAKEEVKDYIGLVDRSRQLLDQMHSDGYKGTLRGLHPKNGEYSAIKGGIGYISYKMSNNPILYKQFFSVAEKGDKLVDHFGSVRELEGINRPVYWASVVYGERAFRLDTAQQRFASSYNSEVRALVKEYAQARGIVGSIVHQYSTTDTKESNAGGGAESRQVNWDSLRKGKWGDIYNANESRRNELAFKLVERIDEKGKGDNPTVGDLLWANVGANQIKEFELLKQDGVASPEQYKAVITQSPDFARQLLDQAIIHEYGELAGKFNSTLSLYVKASVGNTLLRSIESEIGQNKWVNYCRLKTNNIRHIDLRFYGNYVSENLEGKNITHTVDKYVKYNETSAKMGEIWTKAEGSAGIGELKNKIDYQDLEVKDALTRITGTAEGITTYLYDLSMDAANQSIEWKGPFRDYYLDKYGNQPKETRPDWFEERSKYNVLKTKEYVENRVKQDFKPKQADQLQVVERYMEKYDLEQVKLQKVWDKVPKELYLGLKEQRGLAAHELLQDKSFASFVSNYRQEHSELKNIETHSGEYARAHLKTNKQERARPVQKHTYYDADRIKELMNERIVDIADMAFSSAKKQIKGRYVSYGNKGSVRIDTSKGLFNDWESGVGGDALKLYQTHFVRSNNYREVLESASNWLGGAGVTNTIPSPKKPTKNDQAKADSETVNKIAAVNRLYSASQPLSNTLAQSYLNKHRNISQSADLKDVRFVEEYKSPTDSRLTGSHLTPETIPPRLVSFARNSFGEITGCQSIYLDKQSANKSTSVDIVKKSQGSIAGSFVELQADEGHLGKTFVAEGLESALSIKETGVKGRIVCSLGIGNLANLNVHEHSRVIICADNDFHKETSKTHEVIEKAREKMESKGAKVEVVRPYVKGKDFNDILQEKGVGGVSQYVAKHLLEDRARERYLVDKQSLTDKLDNLNVEKLQLDVEIYNTQVKDLTTGMDNLHLSFSSGEPQGRHIKTFRVDEKQDYTQNSFAFKAQARENITSLKGYQRGLEEKAMSGTLASHMDKLRSPEFIAEVLKPNNENKLYDYAREGVELPIEAIDMEKFNAQVEKHKQEPGNIATSLANSIDRAAEIVSNGWQIESLSQAQSPSIEATKTLMGDNELAQSEAVPRNLSVTQTFAQESGNKGLGGMLSHSESYVEVHKALESEINNTQHKLTETNTKLTQNQAGQDMIRANSIDELTQLSLRDLKNLDVVNDKNDIAKKSAEFIYHTTNCEVTPKHLELVNKCVDYYLARKSELAEKDNFEPDNIIADTMYVDRIANIEMKMLVEKVTQDGKLGDGLEAIQETASLELNNNRDNPYDNSKFENINFSNDEEQKSFANTVIRYEEKYGQLNDPTLEAIKSTRPLMLELRDNFIEQEITKIKHCGSLSTEQQELVAAKAIYKTRFVENEVINQLAQGANLADTNINDLSKAAEEKYEKEINIDIAKVEEKDFGPQMRR